MKNKNFIIVLSAIILIVLVGYFIFIEKEVPPQDVKIQNGVAVEFPELFVDREDLLFEERITKLVSELKRSPVAHFSININGVVRGFFDRTIVVEAEGEQLQIPVAEGAAVVTEVWPEMPIPKELANFLPQDFTLFNFLLEVETIIEQELLPQAQPSLIEIRDRVQEKVGHIPEQEMRAWLTLLVVTPDEPVLEPFVLEDIKIGDIVKIQATISPIGELIASEVVVTPITPI